MCRAYIAPAPNLHWFSFFSFTVGAITDSGMRSSVWRSYTLITVIVIWKLLTNTRIYMVSLLEGDRTALTYPYRVNTQPADHSNRRKFHFLFVTSDAKKKNRIFLYLLPSSFRSTSDISGGHKTHFYLHWFCFDFRSLPIFPFNLNGMYRVRCDANICHFSVANTSIFLLLLFFFSHWANIDCPTRRNRIKFKR